LTSRSPAADRLQVCCNAAADHGGMTNNTTTNTTAVDLFLDAVTAGRGIPESLYGNDAVLDATVPNWRFRVDGAGAVTEEYGRWFASPGCFPHAAHHAHLMTVGAERRIERDIAFCGRRWDTGRLARMAGTVR
jgi:hypothetical protein